jgi:dihydrofolate reductase
MARAVAPTVRGTRRDTSVRNGRAVNDEIRSRPSAMPSSSPHIAGGRSRFRLPIDMGVVPFSRMSKLIYITNASLDGYIEDQTGAFDWSNPDQVFDFITELMRPIGTHLLGRRLYETMAYWDAPVEGYPPEHRDFARVWQKAEQIVFSRTLTGAPTRIARLEREFDREATRKLKRESEHDIFIGGAELAGLALESNLVDECHLFVHPVIVGGGKPAFRAAIRRDLELLETRRFGTGAIHLRYRMRGATP